MKIRKTLPGEQYLKDIRSRTEQQAQEQLQRGHGKRGKGTTEEVDVSLGRHIQNELNLDQLQAERDKKVAHIKDLLAKGKYNPSSSDVAESMSNEIFMEIAHSRLANAGNEVE